MEKERGEPIPNRTEKNLEFKDGQETTLPAGAEFYISSLGRDGKTITADKPIRVEVIAQDYGQINVKLLEDLSPECPKGQRAWVKKSSINPDTEL